MESQSLADDGLTSIFADAHVQASEGGSLDGNPSLGLHVTIWLPRAPRVAEASCLDLFPSKLPRQIRLRGQPVPKPWTILYPSG